MCRARKGKPGCVPISVAFTAAGRYAITDKLTGLIEFMHVRSNRGTRVNLGIPAFERQTVYQFSLRYRL